MVVLAAVAKVVTIPIDAKHRYEQPLHTAAAAAAAAAVAVGEEQIDFHTSVGTIAFSGAPFFFNTEQH